MLLLFSHPVYVLVHSAVVPPTQFLRGTEAVSEATLTSSRVTSKNGCQLGETLALYRGSVVLLRTEQKQVISLNHADLVDLVNVRHIGIYHYHRSSPVARAGAQGGPASLLRSWPPML